MFVRPVIKTYCNYRAKLNQFLLSYLCTYVGRRQMLDQDKYHFDLYLCFDFAIPLN